MTYIYWIYGLIAGVIGNFLAITCMMIAMNYQFTSGKKVAFFSWFWQFNSANTMVYDCNFFYVSYKRVSPCCR